jgi:hypothetical protein
VISAASIDPIHHNQEHSVFVCTEEMLKQSVIRKWY